MPAASAPPSAAFKHWFDAALYRRLADELVRLSPGFDRPRFLALTLDQLETRELMDRMRQTAIAFAAALPGSYRDQLVVLRALAPHIGPGFTAISLAEFVARHGIDDFDTSMAALRFFTRFGTAEFAVRPFLQRDLARTLAVMEQWSRDPDEHVRRLASEGSRPRLPWGLRLTELVRDPSPTAPILDQLRDDPSPYVRKSVANHLNDITKDHPDWVVARLHAWDRTPAGTAWIARHALRTLIKRGHPPALALVGADRAPRLVVVGFRATPARLALGSTLQLAVTLRSTSPRAQRLVVDYVIHYARPSGVAAAKVFKWKVLELPGRGEATFTKRQLIRDFSTRRHHPGRHRIDLQINGRRLADTAFHLA